MQLNERANEGRKDLSELLDKNVVVGARTECGFCSDKLDGFSSNKLDVLNSDNYDSNDNKWLICSTNHCVEY